MSVNIWLTDSDSDIEGYKRAVVGGRSSCPSLVRAVTTTMEGPSDGIQVTKTAGGPALAWITDPLDGTDLTNAAWEFHIWAKESAASVNGALRFQVFRFTNAEAASALLDDNQGVELGTVTKDCAITSSTGAQATALNDKDRLVIKVLVEDASGQTMGVGTVTVSYNGFYSSAEGNSYVVCPDDIKLTTELPQSTRDAIRRAIQDTDIDAPLLNDDSIDQCWNEALKTYSEDRPLEDIEYYSGDNSTYEFDMPRHWIQGFSNIVGIEYETGEQRREFLELRDYEVVKSRLGPQPTTRWRFIEEIPSLGTNNIAVRYTTRHVHNDEISTIPLMDLEAVVALAGSNAALKLSAQAAKSSDSAFAADAVNHRDAQIRWNAVSLALRRVYNSQLARPTTALEPSGFTDEWDVKFSNQSDYLVHSKTTR